MLFDALGLFAVKSHWQSAHCINFTMHLTVRVISCNPRKNLKSLFAMTVLKDGISPHKNGHFKITMSLLLDLCLLYLWDHSWLFRINLSPLPTQFTCFLALSVFTLLKFYSSHLSLLDILYGYVFICLFFVSLH